MSESLVKKSSDSKIVVAKQPMAIILKDKNSGDILTELVKRSVSDEQSAKDIASSVISICSINKGLLKCTSGSLIACAMQSRSIHLSMSPALGFTCAVPYNNTKKWKDDDGGWHEEKEMIAQWQIQKKGFVQMALRTGFYKDLDVKPVYATQYTGKFDSNGNEVFDWSGKKEGKIVGYYAYFVLNNGFEKHEYWSIERTLAHATKYSKAYQYDIEKNKKSSQWSTDFDGMGQKTALKMLLSHWGPMSTDLENAMTNDQKVYDSDGQGGYNDNFDFTDEDDGGDEQPAERQETTVKNTIKKPTKEEPKQQAIDEEGDAFDTLDKALGE